MEKTGNSIWKSTMTWGAILGAALIVYAVLLYVLDVDIYNPHGNGRYLTWVNYPIMIGLIWFGMKNYRDETLGGYMSYGKGVGFGTLTGFFAAFLVTVYSYVFIKFIDPGVLDYIYQITEQNMLDQNMPQENVDKAMEMAKKFIIPGMVFGGIFMNTFFSLIVSLIVSAFLKKNNFSFQNDMRNVQ